MSCKLAQCRLSQFRNSASLLCYMPMLLMLLVTTIAFDYSGVTASQYNPATTETISTDQNSPCFKSGSLNLGEANTTEGYRIEDPLLEVRLKDHKTESFKFIALRNSFSVQVKNYFCSNHFRYRLDDPTMDQPVLFHQLLI